MSFKSFCIHRTLVVTCTEARNRHTKQQQASASLFNLYICQIFTDEIIIINYGIAELFVSHAVDAALLVHVVVHMSYDRLESVLHIR